MGISWLAALAMESQGVLNEDSMFVDSDSFASGSEFECESPEASDESSFEASGLTVPVSKSTVPSTRRRLLSTSGARKSCANQKKPRLRRKMLLKSEKDRITNVLLKIDKKKVVAGVTEAMKLQFHLQVFSERQSFWTDSVKVMY